MSTPINHEDEDNDVTSSIDASSIIRNLITLLPKQYQHEANSLMNVDSVFPNLAINTATQPVNDDGEDEGLGEDERAKIDAGCFLWDLSILEEQCDFLRKHHILHIITHLLGEWDKHSQRLIEICIGILANICAIGDICADVIQNGTLISRLDLILNSTNDPLILAELMRLLTVGICCKSQVQTEDGNTVSVKSLWTEKIVGITTTLELLLVILNNSFNSALLERVSSLLLYMSYYQVPPISNKKSIMELLVDLKLIDTILELISQYHSTNVATNETIIENLIRVIETISSTTDIIKTSSNVQPNHITKTLLHFIRKEGEVNGLTVSAVVTLSNIGLDHPDSLKNAHEEDDKSFEQIISISEDGEEDYQNAVNSICNMLGIKSGYNNK